MLRAIIVLTEVQIHSASENTHFSSAKSNIKIPPQKIKKALKNQGFSGRYLFYRLLMAYPKGRRTQCAYSPRKRFALASKLPMQLAFVALRAAKLRLPPQAAKEKAPPTGCFFFGLPERTAHTVRLFATQTLRVSFQVANATFLRRASRCKTSPAPTGSQRKSTHKRGAFSL